MPLTASPLCLVPSCRSPGEAGGLLPWVAAHPWLGSRSGPSLASCLGSICLTALPSPSVCRNTFQDVCILCDMTTHLPVLEIRILECQGEPALPDWGCQPSPALNLQLFLLHWLLFGVCWRKIWGCHRCWGLLGPNCSI